MNRIFRQRVATVCLIGVLSFSGCTQMPTEKTGVSDLRPQISFSANSEDILAARVIVDGMDVGAVSDYKTNEGALRVLPGNHRVQVYSGGRVVIDEKVYVGDGVSRSFLVK